MNGKDDTENNNTLPGELINPKLCKVDHFGCSILDDAVKDSTGRKGNKRGKDGRGGDIVGEKGEAINFRNLKIMTDNTDLFPMKTLTEREINEDQFRMEEEYNSEIEDEMADAMLCQFPPYGSHALSNFLSRHLDENDTVNNDSNHEDYEIEKAKEKEQWCEEDENADEYTAYGDMLMSHGNKDRFGVDYNGDDVGDCNLVEDRFDYDPNYQDDEYGNNLSKYQVDKEREIKDHHRDDNANGNNGKNCQEEGDKSPSFSSWLSWNILPLGSESSEAITPSSVSSHHRSHGRQSSTSPKQYSPPTTQTFRSQDVLRPFILACNYPDASLCLLDVSMNGLILLLMGDAVDKEDGLYLVRVMAIQGNV